MVDESKDIVELHQSFNHCYSVTDNIGRVKLVPYKALVRGFDGKLHEIIVNTKGYRDVEHEVIPKTKDRIIAFGDSCTFGAFGYTNWPTRLRKLLKNKVEVINAAIEGTNSIFCIERIMETENNYKYTIGIVYTGWNDIYGLSYSAVDSLRNNFSIMKGLIDKVGAKMVLCTLPTQVWEDFEPEHLSTITGNRCIPQTQTPITTKNDIMSLSNLIGHFRNIYMEIGMNMNIPVIDLYSHVMGYPIDERVKMFFDPLHPTDEGHKVISKYIKKELMKLKYLK
jgi:hypothetical protein